MYADIFSKLDAREEENHNNNTNSAALSSWWYQCKKTLLWSILLFCEIHINTSCEFVKIGLTVDEYVCPLFNENEEL